MSHNFIAHKFDYEPCLFPHRGLKHIKDKKKYKGNTTKDPKHVPAKRKPSLGSNWDRYDSSEENEEHVLNSSTDFALLSAQPISSGSHYQLKNEPIREEPENSLFLLNMEMLQRSILTIPFNERLGIETDYFKEEDLEVINKNAELNVLSYQNYLKKMNVADVNLDSINIDAEACSSEESEEESKLDASLSKKSEIFDSKLMENLRISSEVKSHEVDESKKESDADELEQWLDDILED